MPSSQWDGPGIVLAKVAGYCAGFFPSVDVCISLLYVRRKGVSGTGGRHGCRYFDGVVVVGSSLLWVLV